jgi:hypothetical protein
MTEENRKVLTELLDWLDSQSRTADLETIHTVAFEGPQILKLRDCLHSLLGDWTQSKL